MWVNLWLWIRKAVNFNKILVPVIGNGTDEEAIKLAQRLLDKKGGICAVCVIAVRRDLPLDAEVGPEISRAEDILDSVEVFAKKQGCGIETELLQAREVAPAIVNEAKERGVDLILMGYEKGCLYHP